MAFLAFVCLAAASALHAVEKVDVANPSIEPCGVRDVKHPFAYKFLNGPPSEFKDRALPPPSASSFLSHHASEPVRFTEVNESEDPVYNLDINVDSPKGFTFAVFLNDASVEYTLLNIHNKNVKLKGKQTSYENGLKKPVDGTLFEIKGPISTGTYKLTIVYKGSKTPTDVQGYIFFDSESQTSVFGSLEAEGEHVVGTKIGVVGKIVESSSTTMSDFLELGTAPTSKATVIVDSATLVTTFPDGHKESTPMNTNAMNGDDGNYRGFVEASQPGSYLFRAIFKGTDNNRPFELVFEDELKIIEKSLAVTGKATGSYAATSNVHRLNINLEVAETSKCSAAGQLFRPYAEVWGKSSAGEDVPIAYATTLSEIKRSNTGSFLPLEVDLRWAIMADANPPYSLKNVYVVEMDEGASINVMTKDIPVDLNVPSTKVLETHAIVSESFNGVVDKVMTQGIAPEFNFNDTVNGKLVTVHGFCAEVNPFEESGDYPDALHYVALSRGDSRSLSNALFAENVLAFINENNLGTFSMVGFSQGGFIPMQILNFYHTGLDVVTGGRKIQTLATPFRGNTGTTYFAALFDLIFPDSGCDVVEDLTRQGSELFLAGLSAETLDETYYYYVVYKSFLNLPYLGYCELISNIFLRNPNDGATELAYASLPNNAGNDCGLTRGQCHNPDMNWPQATTDSKRNSEIIKCAATGGEMTEEQLACCKC